MSSPFAQTDELEPSRAPTTAVRWIIALNVAVYFLQLSLVGDVNMMRWLGFTADSLPAGWWRAFTYMFVHAGLLHLAGNMYMLWLFGPRIERQWSAGGFTRYYLWCGLGGWLAHVLFFRSGVLVGASGAIYGVLVAYAMRWPNDELYFFGAVPVKVKWLVAAYLAYDIVWGLLLPGASGGVAHFAHLGGAAAGWLFLRTPSGQQIDRLRHRIAPVPDLPDETPRAVPRSAPRPREQRGSEVDEIVAKSKAIAAARRPPAPPPPPKPTAAGKKGEALDLVLDKISEHGLDSLTSDERRLLEEMSRKLRDR
jgi:membrane associated rhomboid family serine protease